MKTATNLPNVGLFLLFAISTGCVSTGDRPHHPPLETSTLSRDGDVTSPATTSVTANEDEEAAARSPIMPVAYQPEDDVELQGAPEYGTPDVPSFIGESIDDGLTLESLEQLALQNNPSIRQASAAASKAAGIRTQVGLKPNPSIGYFGEEIGNDSAAGLHGAFVSQTFVRGDKLAWNRTVIGHDVQAARWQAEVQRFRIRNDIRIQFYEALGAQTRLEIARQFREVAEKGVEISEELVRVQEGARPDVLQSEVQLSEVELAIQQADYEFTAAWNELVAIAGLPELAPTILIGDLETPTVDRDIEAEYAQMVAESPLLAAACAQVRRARANLQRQRVQPIPNLNAQVGAGYDDGTGDEFANVQLSLPIPVHNKNQGNIRAAYAAYCAATQNVNRLKMQIRRDLARAMRAHQIAQATVTQYETSILPKVGETLDLMQQAQEAGEFNFLRVLTARRAYFDANLKYVAALADLAQANTRIDGLLLTGGLDQAVSYDGTDELRGAALSGQ